MTVDLLPPATSLAFRANLAQLVSPLRRVRSRTPFFQLPAHRIPTLWSLYRGLLRNSPSEDITFRIRKSFRKHKGLTGTGSTKMYLSRGYKWLDMFTKAKEGDMHLQTVLARYSRLIAARREKEYMRTLVYEDMVWRHKLRNRTILTGGLMRPTLYHGPLPRMKPQPIHVTGMIVSRKKAREKRKERQSKLLEDINVLQIESDFEAGLIAESPNPAKFETVFSGKAYKEWVSPIEGRLAEISESYAHELERAQKSFPQEMLDQIVRARTEKIANKTRERQRERRGEVLKRTIERKNQGPPAHVLAKMTREERRLDWISRGVSEVGYVGQVKRKLGFKLKEPNAWKREEGRESERGTMDEASKDMAEENERRRREVEGQVVVWVWKSRSLLQKSNNMSR